MSNWPYNKHVMDQFISHLALPFGFYGHGVQHALQGANSNIINAVCWAPHEQFYNRLTQYLRITSFSIADKHEWHTYYFRYRLADWRVMCPYDINTFDFYKFVAQLADQPQIGYNGVLYMAPSYFQQLMTA